MHRSFIFMTVVFNFSLLSTWKGILDCSRHFAKFFGKKQREKSRKKTSLSMRTKLNKFGRSLFWWSFTKCAPHFYHWRASSPLKTRGSAVIPCKWTLSVSQGMAQRVERLFVLIYQTLRVMQTCKLRFVGGIVLFFLAFFKNYTHCSCS